MHGRQVLFLSDVVVSELCFSSITVVSGRDVVVGWELVVTLMIEEGRLVTAVSGGGFGVPSMENIE